MAQIRNQFLAKTVWKLFEQPPFIYISQLVYISLNVHLYRRVLSIEAGHRNLNTENLLTMALAFTIVTRRSIRYTHRYQIKCVKNISERR